MIISQFSRSSGMAISFFLPPRCYQPTVLPRRLGRLLFPKAVVRARGQEAVGWGVTGLFKVAGYALVRSPVVLSGLYRKALSLGWMGFGGAFAQVRKGLTSERTGAILHLTSIASPK